MLVSEVRVSSDGGRLGGRDEALDGEPFTLDTAYTDITNAGMAIMQMPQMQKGNNTDKL